MKIFLLLISTILVAAEKVRYDNFQVYRVTPRDQTALEGLRNLQDNPMGFSFWSDASNIARNVDILVPPHLKLQFLDIIRSLNLDSTIFIDNVQELIDNENPKVRSRAVAAYDWTSYQTLDEIYEWLQLVAESNPNTTTLIKGGSSYEERDILGLRISLKPGNEQRSVFIESNIHAREWISSAVTTYFINEILTSNDANIREIAESHDWYIFPVTNPDGFVYSHTDDRMWRKTRTPHLLCYGVDPNRNWGYHYNTGGTSGISCMEDYRGPEAFSEPSTKSLSEFISTVGSDLRAYFALHSYSQYILLPYGYTATHLDNYNELYSVGLKAASSLARRHGTNYTVGNIVDLLYVASGGSIDWVKGNYGTRIVYAYELPDTGRYGFVLPASLILPTAEETVDSLVTILQEFDEIDRRSASKSGKE